MNKLGIYTSLALCLALGIPVAQVEAQAPKQSFASRSADNPKSITLKLRELYINRDYEAGYELGKKSAAQYPDNVELQAWYLMNMSRSSQSAEAVALAKSLNDKNQDHIWALIASVNALVNSPKVADALPVAEKLIKIAPDNEEAIFTYYSALFQNSKYAEALAWLDKNAAKMKDQSRFYASRANTAFQLNRASKEETKFKTAFEDLDKALKLNSNHATSNYLYGYYLNNEKRYDESLPFLRKSVKLSPSNLQAHQEYWKAIPEQKTKAEAEKNAEMATDVNAFLAARNNTPEALLIVVQSYDKFGNAEKRDFYGDQILQKYPNTKYDETILYSRFNRSSKKYFKDEPDLMVDVRNKKAAERTEEEKKALAEYDKKKDADYQVKWKNYTDERAVLWRAYINRPIHFDEGKLSNVYYEIFRNLGSRRETTDAELTEIFDGVLKYQKLYPFAINSHIAENLLTAKADRPNSQLNTQAEKYARAGITEAAEKKTTFPTQAKNLEVSSQTTLAKVLIQAEKLDEAEQLLLQAEKLTAGNLSTDSTLTYLRDSVIYNLANLYTAKKDFDKAEAYYLKNAETPNSVKGMLRKLYERKSGNLEGFDAYFDGVREKFTIIKRERILATRLNNSKNAAPFKLQTIDGKTMSLDELKGKVVVINFWGTWCSPCVAEMPEFQQLYKKYENDKDVAIITMDSNDELDAVKKFMTEKKYDFPVLIGDSYISNIMFNNTIGFPTTLFISKQGKVEFIKTMLSQSLYEEFGWRIEALKADN